MQSNTNPVNLSTDLNYTAPICQRVVRVFDTNGFGTLRPVSFTTGPLRDGFQLDHPPAGQVFVELRPADQLPTPADVYNAVDVLVGACHGAAQHWWKNPKTGADTRDNPMCFDQKLLLVVSEIVESMEGNRKDLMDDKLPHRKMREVELGDALIRIGDMAGGFGLDLAGAVVEKMQFNAIRPDHKTENRVKEGGKAY
jgi:NTP pyrophosphatase (non-canonical NTP hydrolase)